VYLLWIDGAIIWRAESARRAQILEDALLAQRPARITNATTVPDEEMREPRPVRTVHNTLQIALDLHRIVVSREA